MRVWLARLGALLMTFAVGVAISFLISRQGASPPRHRVKTYPSTNNCETKLVENLISLRQPEVALSKSDSESGGDFMWQWLKKEIAIYQSRPGYERNSAVLPLTGDHKYSLETHQLSKEELALFNGFLRKKERPPLNGQQCYVSVAIHLDGWVCPNWTATISVNDLRLVDFHGEGP
jgi:hypothetical protein